MSGMEKFGAKIALMMTAMIIISWCVLAGQETGWLSKSSPYYSVSLGLLYVKMGGGVTGAIAGALSPRLSNWVKRFFPLDTYTTEDFKERACNIPVAQIIGLTGSVCQTGRNVHYASLTMLTIIFFAIILQSSAAILLYRWAFSKARAQLRTWICVLYAISVVLLIFGNIQYLWLCHSIADLPPTNEAISFGPSSILSCLLTLVSAMPLAIVLIFVSPSLEEVMNEELSSRKKLMREQDKLYGTAGSDAMPSQPTLQESYLAPQSFGPPSPVAYPYANVQQPSGYSYADPAGPGMDSSMMSSGTPPMYGAAPIYGAPAFPGSS